MTTDGASRLQTLIEINQQLVGTLDPDELLRRILESVTRLFSADGCSIALVDEAEKQLAFTTMVGSIEPQELRLELGQGIVGWVAERGVPVVANDVSRDPRFFSGVDRSTGFQTRAILCAPLKRRDRTIGALEVLNTASPEGFSEQDLELLSAFAGVAATALERSAAFTRLRSANRALQEEVDDRYSLVVGTSPAMAEIVATVRTAAAAPTTVLLLGESGVGKEVLARAVHRWSPRREGPFVAVNCVALTPELLESELFGHERGAFTGATAQKKGRFELANGGTIFLDEIGDLAPHLQAKLLRVLQEREFVRVGGTREIRTDVRVVAATNRDLRRAMAEGKFREDLYYRLNVVSLRIPPLRERSGDVPALLDRFVERYARELGRGPLAVSEGALRLLVAYTWPGNVRELQNAIERAVVLCPSHELTERDLPAEIRQAGGPDEAKGSAADPYAGLPLTEAVDAFKADRIRAALAAAGGNQTQAAKLLGMRQPNLSRLMRTLDLK